VSKDEILVNDFGAGSKVFKGNLRSVSKIAKIASVRRKYGLLLMRLVPYLKISNSLELGTSMGIASSCIGFADAQAKLLTLEGCENTANVAKEQFDFFGLKNIEVIVGDFNQTLQINIENKLFDMIYFDGNHTKEATLRYFTQTLQSKHNDSVFIFDDIHWNAEMCDAWKEIKKHSEVTVTIDTFQWGIVFFRKEQKKEHFTIRI
jgi:predicted O-methyltransferase YrrM